MTQKKDKFVRLEKCDKNFQLLKDMLSSAQVLTLPEETKWFVIYCDTSGVGLGCVIMQHWKVIAYTSRKHKVNENNYLNHDF